MSQHSGPMLNFFKSIIEYRILVSIVLFVICVSLELHGSSIANWNNFGVRETVNGLQQSTINGFSREDTSIDYIETAVNWISIPPREDGTILGYPRMIRSDEWLVQTPFYLSQASRKLQVENPNYAVSGQNMIVAYNAPVRHISIIGKPFNWGFLFLSNAKALSWYWSLKIIGFLLLAFEFSMILTRKNKWLSAIGSFWITYTPVIQWWFMQHLGDIVFFTLLIAVSIYHYFKSSYIWPKLLFSSMLSIGIVGFVLVIYPAFQVVFGYFILLFFIVNLHKAIKNKLINKIDFFFIVATVLFSVTIIGYSLYGSLDALKLTLDTVYPGNRVSSGGEVTINELAGVLLNFVLPFKTPGFSNQVELSNGLHFIFPILVLLPFVVKTKDIKREWLGVLLCIFSIILAFYSIIGFPEIVSKVTLFSFVTSGRAWQAMSVFSVFSTIWAIGLIWNQKLAIRKAILLPTTFFVTIGLFFIFFSNQDYIGFLGKKVGIILIVCLSLTFWLLVSRKKVAFIMLIGLIGISGMTVNPMVQGLPMLDNKILVHKIKEIVNKDSGAIWINDNNQLYNFPQMFGAISVDGVRFYPDKKLMEKLDPSHKYESNWNRYSHVHYTLIHEKTKFENPAPDNLHIQLEYSQLNKLNVKYVLTNRELDTEFGNSFKLIYGSDLDGNRIYQYDR
ncbi:hypothetical protein ACHBIE_07725 [Streptococcus sp. A23]|uniref:DUF7657 domain-containing protein n=1 Tax=Streptococcus sp. A23 TaxID=3373127 RepID=UPI00374CE56D